MMSRPFIAILLLINYLVVVGAGCVNRPEDAHELVLVRTKITEEGRHYQQSRYLRMDGLEAFLVEELAARYGKDNKSTQQHLFFVVNGVDAHHLQAAVAWVPVVAGHWMPAPAIACDPLVTSDAERSLYTPPWQG